DIAYAATASVGYLEDFMMKVQKAKEVKGTSYIHILAPCPTGWGTATEITIALAKEAVDCGLWYLAEYENGAFKLNKNPKEFTPIENYVKQQGRFKHLKEDDIKTLEAHRDYKWNKMRQNWNV
ncbi:MAG TPA: pyruvate synthase subunit beta, partial [Fusibacter sp.]|nr:pyruvate synthase subunit beta [Fusibacter sp.]